jgi:hypothetical protein
MFAALFLGFSLSRFSVFALMVASIFSAASFLLCLVQGSTLAHSILLSLAIAFVVQIGYLIGQVCNALGARNRNSVPVEV